MTTLSVKIDTKAVDRMLAGMPEQVDFATATAINNMAFGARDKWPDIITPQVESPVAFTKTKKAIRVEKATKQNLRGSVELGYLQADYLEAPIFGERRDLKRSEQRARVPRAIPARNIKLDRNGNIRLPGSGARGVRYGKILEEAKKPRGAYFIVNFDEATPGRPAGIYQRMKGKRKTKPEGTYQRNRAGQRNRIGRAKKARQTDRARPLFIFVEGKRYKNTIKFHEPIIKELDRLMPGELRKAVDRAIRTAR